MSKINVFGQLFSITTDGIVAQIDQIKDVRTTGEFAGKFQSEINDALLAKIATSGTDISGKVDKVQGKSLVSDTLITKLEGLSTQAQLNTAIADAKKAGTNAATLANTAQSTINSYKTSNDKALKDGLAAKVDKVSGKSLVSDTEITKLAGLKSQTAMESLMDTKISAAVTSVLKWQGVKSSLPDIEGIASPTKGDVWHNNADGGEYVYNGSGWEELGTPINLSSYATQAWVKQQGYLTSHQDLSSYATKTYVDGKETSLNSKISTNTTNILNINEFVARGRYSDEILICQFMNGNTIDNASKVITNIIKFGCYTVDMTNGNSEAYLNITTNKSKLYWQVLVNGFPIKFTRISDTNFKSVDKVVSGAEFKVTFIPTPNNAFAG